MTASGAVGGVSRRRARLGVVGMVVIGVVVTGAACSSSPAGPGAATPARSASGEPAQVAPTQQPTQEPTQVESAPADAAVRLSADQFRATVTRPGVVVLDVRTAQEYAEGHVAGARNIDVERPDFATRVAALDRSASYAVYCRSGNRSQRAVQLMQAAGLTRIVELDGGILALQRAGVGLVTG